MEDISPPRAFQMRTPTNPNTSSAEFRTALMTAKTPPVMANIAAKDKLETVRIQTLKLGKFSLNPSVSSRKRWKQNEKLNLFCYHNHHCNFTADSKRE